MDLVRNEAIGQKFTSKIPRVEDKSMSMEDKPAARPKTRRGRPRPITSRPLPSPVDIGLLGNDTIGCDLMLPNVTQCYLMDVFASRVYSYL